MGMNQQTMIILIVMFVIFMIFLYRSDVFGGTCIEGFGSNNNDSIAEYKIDKVLCSPNCCTKQWPLKFYDQGLDSNSPYVPSNFRCNNGLSSGCPCITKKQMNFLTSRGGNYPLNRKYNLDAIRYDDVGCGGTTEVYPITKSRPQTLYQINNDDAYVLPNNGLIVNTSELHAMPSYYGNRNSFDNIKKNKSIQLDTLNEIV